ncbi:MAG: hypothetical protein ACRD2B_18590 [Terriglobia bacterium]
MKWIKGSLLIAFLLPVALVAASEGLPNVTPQDIGSRRAKLYLEAAREPLARMAPKIYQFALDSERCRLASGAEACGLGKTPLKDGSLKGIFNYYVKQPVEAALNQRQVKIRKSHWIWEPSAPHR